MARQLTGKGSLPINVAANLTSLALSIVIGIFLVPYLISKLGVDSFGLITLANYFVQYMTLATFAVNSSVGRYLTIALEQGDHVHAVRVYSTAFWANIAVVVVLVLISIPLVIFLDRIVVLPEGKAAGARYLFTCVFLAYFIGLASSVFSVSCWARNRFDLLNGMGVFRQGLYLSAVLVLLAYMENGLAAMGNAIVLSAFAAALGSYLLSRLVLPEIRVKFAAFDAGALKSLLSTGGWITVNMFGSILYLKIDLFLVNRLCGAVSGGQYAAVLQWSGVIRTLGSAVSSVFGPPLTFLYAQGEQEALARYARRAVRYLGILIACPIGLLCGFSEAILSLWLGPEYGRFSWLMSLLTLHLCVNVAVYPLFELQTATNNVRLPGIVTCVMGVGNLLLALGLGIFTDMGMYGVAFAGALMLTLKNALFTPVYGATIIHQPWHTFLKEMATITAAVAAVFVCARIFMFSFSISSLLDVVSWSLLIGTFYAIVAWALVLNGEDRDMLLGYLVRFRRRMWMAHAGK